MKASQAVPAAMAAAFSLLATATTAQVALPGYKGIPFSDSRHSGGPQQIPGRVECALYDFGGEGVAYHVSSSHNHGSGDLNPANGDYLNEFRMHEAVSTSYTKFNRTPIAIDDTSFDKVKPPADQLYVGWTEVGEWLNITVDVAKDGDYSADLLYTSNGGGAISIDVNGKPATGPIEVASTYDAADPVAWRQWHHWNLAHGLFRLHLAAGRNVLTLHVAEGGNMNLAFLDFTKA